MKAEEYKEGGNNGAVLKFPSRVTWSQPHAQEGCRPSAPTLWDWHYGFVEGKGKRRDGVIVLLTSCTCRNNIWYFRRGLPVKYTGPS